MTTAFQTYRDGIKDSIEASAGFPAEVSTSTVRAFTRDEDKVLVLHAGREVIAPDGAWPRVIRIRELLCSVHTAGADRDDYAEAVFEALQPIVMQYAAPGLVKVEEFGTDEPKYLQGDLARMITTKRFRLTYQTEENSLKQLEDP